MVEIHLIPTYHITIPPLINHSPVHQRGMESSDLLLDFGDLDEYPEAIPSVDGTPRTGILNLPIELLLDISQYSKYSDIYSLIRVNRIFHAIGIQRFYSLIPLHVNRLALPPSDQLPDDTLDAIIPHLTCRYSSVFRGLFARQEHLEALRTLVICGQLTWKAQEHRKVLYTILHGVLSRCKKVQTLTLRVEMGYNVDPFSFEGITFPEYVSTVGLKDMSSVTRSLLSSLSSFNVLDIRSWEDPTSLDQISPELGATLVELRCTWQLSDRFPEWTCETFSKRIVSLVPNLKRLAIGYKVTDVEKHIWQAHMNPEILNGYLFITRKLQKLEHLTLLYFGPQTCRFEDIATAATEVETVRQFITTRPALQRLTLHNYYYYNGFNGTRPQTITWKKDREDGDESSKVTWTPDPTVASHWEHWFAAYATALEVRKMMSKFWREECDIPLIDRLRGWEVEHISTRINFRPLGWN